MYIHRVWNQLSCQALNHLFSPERYFQAAWPRKDNVSLSHGAREMLTFQNSWHESLPGHWLLVLETFKFTRDFDLIAVAQGAASSLHCTPMDSLKLYLSAADNLVLIPLWQHCASFLVCVASFLHMRSGSYSGKTRDSRNKVSAQLPVHISFSHLLIAFPFLLLAGGSRAWFCNCIEHLKLTAFSFLEKSLLEKFSSGHRGTPKWKRLCQSAVIPA